MMADSLGAQLELAEKFREYARTRDQVLRDELIRAHLGLVEQIARRFAHRGESFDDLIQAGSIGLIKAVERFDPSLGYEFSAYVTPTIVGELKRHLRDKGWSVRAPRRIQELYLRIGLSIEELSQHLGRSPTVQELAQATGARDEDVHEALEAGNAYRSASLDAPGLEGEPLGDRFGAIEEEFLTAEARAVLLPHLAALPERERTIIELRYFQDLTQAEIAERVGISQMQVSRLLTRSLAFLHSTCDISELL